MKKLTAAILASAFAATMLTGCDSVNSVLNTRTEITEYYRIFDVKTKADIDQMAEAVKVGFSYNAQPSVHREIPTYAELPEKPGRFTLANPFKGSQMEALMKLNGAAISKVMVCDGALVTATANRDVMDSPVTLQVCVYPYKQGYHVDMYASMTKTSGGLYEVSRQAAYSVVGNPEEWIEKCFLDVMNEVDRTTQSQIKLLEAYPKVENTPWHYTGKTFEK